MRILVSWIGHTDLKALLEGATTSLRKEIEEVVRPPYDAPKDGGPIKTLVSQEDFDHIFLISDNSTSLTKQYVQWLGNNASVKHVKLQTPTDYSEIYKVASDFMAEITNKLEGKKYELSILLSPGTPAMAAIWVLLGKTKYSAVFWQTWNGKANRENIPFDLTLDVVPELISSSDNIFHHLSTRSPEETKGFEGIIGDSKAIRIAVGRAQKAAIRDVSILLTGESGTGKEMFARAIHRASRRCEKPFIPINCAAIPRELLESELFGHTKGAFTGAEKAKDGAFKRADGGIIFLDEVGECDMQIQAKLLRVLQSPPDQPPCYREFYPVGATKPEASNVRVIAATNRDLLSLIEKNEFREDLFYRLAVITIKLPPLRDRRSDIPRIAQAIINQINQDFSLQDASYEHKIFSPATNIFIKKHSWPGNVRELYNAILQASVMSDSKIINPEDIRATLIESSGKLVDKELLNEPLGEGFSIEEHLNSIHRHYLQRAIREANGVKTKAATLLGLKSYQAMDAQIERLKVDLKDIKHADEL